MLIYIIKILRKISKLIIVFGLRAPYFRGKKNHDNIVIQLSANRFHRCLDIGSGPSPRNLFNAEFLLGVDIRSHNQETIFKCDLSTEILPFENSYFDCLTAVDVLEHIPRVMHKENNIIFPFVNLMNEIWRVLKIGGYFYSYTPCYPMKSAFQDPTHVNIITEDTINLYFCEKSWARMYGFYGCFILVNEGWLGEHYWCVLKKVSDDRYNDINFIPK